MNQYIRQLAQIGQNEARTIIGLMSGTSLDGLDIALCRIKGSGVDTEVQLLQFTTVPFNDDFKQKVRAVFSKKMVDMELLCLMNPWIAEQHAAMILGALAQWGVQPKEIDLLASHGQTVYHAPKILHGKAGYGNATLQIGDGDTLAVKTGIITISDFRQKHIAAGGEGAPLAVYGDYLVFSKEGEHRIMLNIGGIANFTFLSGDLNMASVYCTDTGPGNTLMDALAQKHFNTPYDQDAAIGKQGQVNEALLEALLDHPFFQQPFPKTTGPELFNLEYVAAALDRAGLEWESLTAGHSAEQRDAKTLSLYDLMATINRFSAVTIVDATQRSLTAGEKYAVYSSGGGMHNPLLMQYIQAALPDCRFYTTKELDVDPDAKEAVLFAILANECVAGGTTQVGGGRKDIPAVAMGKISLPG